MEPTRAADDSFAVPNHHAPLPNWSSGNECTEFGLATGAAGDGGPFGRGAGEVDLGPVPAFTVAYGSRGRLAWAGRIRRGLASGARRLASRRSLHVGMDDDEAS